MTLDQLRIFVGVAEREHMTRAAEALRLTAEDALEFILVGAHAVQVGTATFLRPDTAFRLVDEIDALCGELSLQSFEGYRGSLSI